MSAEPEKLGVIYNPKAGTRKVQKRWKEIKEYIDSKGVPYDYVQSEGFGSVERLAGILANNGYRTIVVVGGDGALNDVINGIMLSNAPDKENIAIGIIPNGIGNDFADYWEMSSDYKKAVDCIINNRRRKIDVGTCYYYDGEKHLTRYFLNAINIGLGARIVKITDQCKRFWGVKFLSYFMAFLSLIFERKLYRVHLKINGEHIRGRIMTICIGSAWGYGQAPSAVPYNGWLDVSVIYRRIITAFFGNMDADGRENPKPQSSKALSYPKDKSITCTECFRRFGRTHPRPPFSIGHRSAARSDNIDYTKLKNELFITYKYMIELKNNPAGNFFLLAGPCVIEGEDMAMRIAERVVTITDKLQIPYVFKGSYRKANRSRLDSFMGIGDEKALKILQKVHDTFGVPTVTDIHAAEEAVMAAEYVDILQIPAFLCRQTDLLVTAAKTGKIINIKKGQFLSPLAMRFAADKVVEAGNNNVMITERGTTFGYQDLVVDYRGIPEMQTFGFPVILDVTHSLQQPNQTSGVTGGMPQLIETVAKAGIAVGADGLFIETHENPAIAKSDGANMLKLDLLEGLLTKLVRIREAIK